MNFVSNRYVLKIPSEICVIYSEKNMHILISNNLKKEVIKLKVKLKVLTSLNKIVVTNLPFSKTLGKSKNISKSLQGRTYFAIKKIFKRLKILTCKKLKLIGVGYKIFENNLKGLSCEFLNFKLGYSHSVYYKIPDNIKIIIRQSNKLFVLGYDYNLVNQTASTIRSYKKPDPYKGKGILYYNESIILKEGKKT